MCSGDSGQRTESTRGWNMLCCPERGWKGKGRKGMGWDGKLKMTSITDVVSYDWLGEK